MFCTIDIETTGLNAGRHAMIELAILPLNNDFSINDEIEPFEVRIKADENAEIDAKAMEINGLDATEGDEYSLAQERLIVWLNQVTDKGIDRLVPIGQNYQFDKQWIEPFVGKYGKYFSRRYRDTMITAAAINDAQQINSGPHKFKSLSLGYLCEYYGIERHQAHRALGDCIDTAKVYVKLLEDLMPF